MLPVHPTLLHPRSGLPIIAIGYRRNGRPIWPVMGGNGEGEGEGGTGEGAGGGEGEGGQSAKGYPENTPVKDMKPEEQIAYHQAQSRKWEDRAKESLKKLDGFDDMKAKADKHDALEAELRTDQEKQIHAATEAGKAAARAELAPQLVEAKFEALSAGRQVNGEPLKVDAIVAGIDPARFLDAAGKADAAKVTAYLDSIAPVTATATVRTGPSAHGSGPRTNAGALTGKEQGAAEALKRFGPKSTATT